MKNVGKIRVERVYVKVNSAFDETGYMQPKTMNIVVKHVPADKDGVRIIARAFIMPTKQVEVFLPAHGLEPDSQPKEYDEITPEHAPWLGEEA